MFSAVNHEFAKAHFEDPRRIDLKARSGQLAKSPIMLVDFKLLHLLGKERDGPRVEEERALRRPCLNRFVFIEVFHIVQHVPPAHFGSPNTDSGALGGNSFMLQATSSWCESWLV